MNDEQKLKKYAGLKVQIKDLENQVEILQPEIMDIIMDSGSPTIDSRFGTFALKERRSYEYPEEIIKKEQELKEVKKIYEHSSDAVLKNVSCSVYFMVKREENG